MTHTPGDWSVQGRFIVVGGVAVGEAFQNSIAYSAERAHANARLMAGAPRLLAALKRALPALTVSAEHDIDDARALDDAIAAIEQVEA